MDIASALHWVYIEITLAQTHQHFTSINYKSTADVASILAGRFRQDSVGHYVGITLVLLASH